jgi:type I restriction enzyme S subunit
LPIIYPRAIDEQKAIAKKLSAIDELIAGLSEQIEKKRQLKEGVMQQLLTGKTRLQGFTQPWHEVQIGKIGYTYPGITGKSKDDFNCGDARYITFLNVLNNPVIDTSIFERVNISPTEGQNAAHKGDLFFNTSSETPEEVGICAVLNEEIENLYLNSFCFGYRLTDDSVLGHYLAYFWRSKRGREIMTSLAQGATRYNLSKAYFNKVNLIIPQTKDEQIAIVDVLNTMDDEICQLEAERDKYTLIKQGMMQELLTGKIRLI